MAENKWLPSTLSGPIPSALDASSQASFAESDLELSYMRGLSIDTAEADVLIKIGLLVGLPWPSAPAGTFSNNRFTFDAAAYFPTLSNLKGFGGMGLVIGGGLSTARDDTKVLMPISSYRALLKLIATAKIKGFSVKTLDDLVHAFVSTPYTISWNSDYDIVCAFHPIIDTGPLFIIQKVIDLMTISPRVILEQVP